MRSFPLASAKANGQSTKTSRRENLSGRSGLLCAAAVDKSEERPGVRFWCKFRGCLGFSGIQEKTIGIGGSRALFYSRWVVNSRCVFRPLRATQELALNSTNRLWKKPGAGATMAEGGLVDLHC